MSLKRILVVGATGKQGGAVIQSLLANPPKFSHKILALTRNTSSPAAKKLASQNVSLVQGDLVDTSLKDIDTAFLVTVPSMKKHKPGVTDPEVIQGRAFIDAALASNVKHIIFSSVDRGGEKSWTNPTPIPHFITKHELELYLRDKTASTNTTYTILRPVAFMDNYKAGFQGKVWAAVWAQMARRLQVVATKDIGMIAARAIREPDNPEFKNQAISLVGDELNQQEAGEAMLKATGQPMEQSYGFLGRIVKWAIADFGTMCKWFDEGGLGGDLEKCRRLHPDMMTFETWLKQESEYRRLE